MPEKKPVVIAQTGVSIEIQHRSWTIRTGWPSWGRRTLDVLIHEIIDENVGGAGAFAKQYRINMLSSSARNGLAQRLDDRDQKKDLQRFLDTVAEILATQLETTSQGAFHNMAEVETAPLEWIIYPFWPATGVTGLAAAPSSLKSFLSLAAALQVATGEEVLPGNTRAPAEPGTILFLDWEDTEQSYLRRRKALEVGAGLEHRRHPIAYINPKRSLVQSIDDLSHTITDLEPKAIIIDSMSAAIDGSMNDSDVVNEFYNAVHALGAPALVITHKSIENQRQRRAAFQGSGMSLARVRMAWNAEKAKNNAIVWQCFKDNHGNRTNSRLAWTVDFTNSGEQDEILERVDIAAINPSRVQITKASEEEKANATEKHYQRISEALDEAGPIGMTITDLAAALAQNAGTVRNRIGEMHVDGRVIKEQEKGRTNRWWHPPHHESLLSQRNETEDGGRQDDLPDPY